MTIVVKLEDCRASEMMDIVNDLRREGHIQGVDFDFAYNPNNKYDGFAMYDPSHKPYADFIFYTEELALFFKLRYERSK